MPNIRANLTNIRRMPNKIPMDHQMTNIDKYDTTDCIRSQK